MTGERSVRIAVLASGGGSNLGALLERFPPGGRPGSGGGPGQAAPEIEVALVVTDRPGVGALDRAARAGVPAAVIRPRDFATPEAYGERLLHLLRQHWIDLVVLAGFLKQIPANVLDAYPRRILNVHPALLPRFGGSGMYGERVHAAVLAAGERESGASVHFVDADYDHGPVIAQARVPVEPGDDVHSLARRVLAEEHRLLPRVVELVARGRVGLGPDGSVNILEEDGVTRTGSQEGSSSRGGLA